MNKDYWLGFCSCLIIFAVFIEVFMAFYNSLDLEIVKILGKGLLFWLPIYMTLTAVIGFILVFHKREDLKEAEE